MIIIKMITSSTFDSFDEKKACKTKETYQCLKPELITAFENYLNSQRTSNRGRKREQDLNIFFKAFYAVVRDSVSTNNLEDYFGIPKGTYFYYLNRLATSGIIENFSKEVMSDYQLEDVLMGDTFTVKSHDGKEDVGRNPTDRGRNGIKVQVIADIKGVISEVKVSPANTHDSRILRENLPHNDTIQRSLLLDSAYTGKPVEEALQTQNLRPVVVPKKKRNGQKTHTLNDHDKQLIKRRWKVERVIGVLRRYKGISNKYTKLINNYIFYLQFAVFVVACFTIFMT